MNATRKLLEVGTAVVADILDTMQVEPPVLDTNLFSIEGPGVRFAGPAFTIQGRSQGWPGGGDRAKLAAIDSMPSGVVAVWAGTDIRGVCCYGDLLAEAMKARNVAGVVVDGGVRDIAYLRTLNLPMLARYHTPAQAIGRWRVTDFQIPVRLRGALQDDITIKPGDLMVVDDDGVIAVPPDLLPEIITRIEVWSEQESSAREEIRRGMPLLVALEKYGHL